MKRLEDTFRKRLFEMSNTWSFLHWENLLSSKLTSRLLPKSRLVKFPKFKSMLKSISGIWFELKSRNSQLVKPLKHPCESVFNTFLWSDKFLRPINLKNTFAFKLSNKLSFRSKLTRLGKLKSRLELNWSIWFAFRRRVVNLLSRPKVLTAIEAAFNLLQLKSNTCIFVWLVKKLAFTLVNTFWLKLKKIILLRPVSCAAIIFAVIWFELKSSVWIWTKLASELASTLVIVLTLIFIYCREFKPKNVFVCM